MSDQLLAITLCVIGIGIGLLSALLWAGFRIFKHFDHELCRWLDFHVSNMPPGVPSRVLVDLTTDYRERKNEFWTLYGQVILAVLIVVLLSVLLLTKTTSAEAGLPILSAISGFAIAKGVNVTKSRQGDDHPNY